MTLTWPGPTLDVWNRPFWDAAAEHRLSVQRCTSCQELRYPAGPSCPQCLSSDTEWVGLSGRGEVQSWVVFHQVYYPGLSEAVPYNVVLIRLEEGLRFISNVVGVANDEIRIGMPVTVVFDDVESGHAVPRFTPA
ncbi:Zn-ribbon domain-containing OB-fold protein [Geodermatophilus sp. URMC 64]